MKKMIVSMVFAGMFLAICGNANADDDFQDKANLENRIGGAFITGLKAWEFSGEWGLSPRLGGQFMVPKINVFVAPIFNFGSLLLKPDDTVVKKASHFSFELLIGFYVYKSKRFDLGLEFGPGYLGHEITTEDGEIVKKEMSGVNFSYGVMMRLGKMFHLNLSLSTSSIGEGIEFKPIQCYALGFGLGWYAT
jgi:hypothetical protein